MGAYIWQRWIADELRAAGLKVVEVEGWKNRGRPASTGSFNPVDGTTNHHTASHTSASNPRPTLKTLIQGRPDLPGPLAQVSTAYDGTVYVIAAGRANHAGRTNRSVPGVNAGADGNAHFRGNEIDTDGTQQVSPEQRHSVAVVNRVFTDHDRATDDHIHRHADITTRKWDIGSISTKQLRADAAAINQEDDMPTPEDVAKAVFDHPFKVRENGKEVTTTLGELGRDLHNHLLAGNAKLREIDTTLDAVKAAVDALGKAQSQPPGQ